jgi:high-affinity iron transporter
MLLTAVIIVLREVLEAALLISILSALSGILGLRHRWIAWSLVAGMAGAITLGSTIDTVSGWFDGVGQEVSSAGMQLVIYLLLGIFIFLLLVRAGTGRHRDRTLMILMIAIVALAVAREGYEVLVYITGFVMNLEQLMIVLVGTAIGGGIGISVGALVYYLLINLRHPWSQVCGIGLLILVAAGLASQAALLLIQADWLPSQLPAWDTSAVIAEDSVTGQLLYAMIGYEATPTAIQAGSYFGGGLLLLAIVFMAFRSCRQQGDETSAS